MKIHELKILPQYFEEVSSGSKTFELRKDDRGFEVGSVILLWEFDGKVYTGRLIAVKITYILRNAPDYGLMDGYAILGIGEVIIDPS